MESNANNYTGESKTAGTAKPLTAEELISDVVTPKDVMPRDAANAFIYGIKSFETLPEIKPYSSDTLEYLIEKINECRDSSSLNPGAYIPLERLHKILGYIEFLKSKQLITCKDCKWRGTMKVRGRNGEEIYYCKNGYGLQQTILPKNYCCMAEKE